MTSSSVRLFERSATRPAHAPSRRIGPNWAAVSSPTAMPLPVRCRTSSTRAIEVSQLPTCEMSCPVKNSRKFRTEASGTCCGVAPSCDASQGSSSQSTSSSTISAARESAATSAGQKLEASGEPRRAARPAGVDLAAPRLGDRDPDEATVGGIRTSFDESARSELIDRRRDAGVRHPLASGDVARGQRALAGDREQGRGEGGGEVVVVVLAQDARQPHERSPEPLGDLSGVGGVGSGLRSCARGRHAASVADS